MVYNWVISSFTGEQAKHVRTHADSGIGYFIQQEGGMGQGHTIVAAFRVPAARPLEPHQTLALQHQAVKLDALYEARHGVKVYV